MRNVLDKSRTENQNTHLCSITFFPESHAVYEITSKKWWSQRGHKLRHNMAHTRCMLYNQGYAHASAPTTRQICNTYCLFTAVIIHERASMLSYTYTTCYIWFWDWWPFVSHEICIHVCNYVMYVRMYICIR